MQRFFIIAILTLFLAPGLHSQNPQPAPSDDDVVKITTALVQLDVTVIDKKGKAVRDLNPEKIEIYENAKKQLHWPIFTKVDSLPELWAR